MVPTSMDSLLVEQDPPENPYPIHSSLLHILHLSGSDPAVKDMMVIMAQNIVIGDVITLRKN